MKASHYIARYLAKQGVTHVFEVVGGMISHIIDSCHQEGAPHLVSVHHEQAAAFAAEAYGRVTGIPGVAMATSGPGAINLLTGIGSCYFDSSPAVFITGQVNRHEQKGNLPIRQLGFQEADIVSIASPITKAAFKVDQVDQLPDILNKSFEIALSGRQGPVLIDIPLDIQREDIVENKIATISPSIPLQANDKQITDLLAALSHAKRPLILVGGGAKRHISAFRQFVENVGVPVVYSLMAVDALPSTSAYHIGLIGSYGNRWANMSIGMSDLIIVLGSRLDIRQTGVDTEAFKGNRIIFHIDCDKPEINNRVQGCQSIISDLGYFFKTANKIIANGNFSNDCQTWLSEINQMKKKWPDTKELENIPGINPNIFMRELGYNSPLNSAYIIDVGQHQMWAAQSIPLLDNQLFITSGGMGAMGFSLPAAIGASMAMPNKPMTVIAGDGSFQLNIQELETVRRNNLPLKIIIINNQCHGMVRQFQESYFDKRYQSTLWGYSAPDFAKVASAYGIDSATIQDPQEIDSSLNALWRNPHKPFLLQVMIDINLNVYPKIAFGKPMFEMEPFAKPIALEAT